jgi:AcrR family transcriptional regulator
MVSYMTSQGQRRADTRARLLQAAADCFAARGVDAVSVDAVAEVAGRTSGAVYDHFGSKQGLVMAVLDEWRQSVVGTVLSELQAAADLPTRLRALVAALVVDPSPATRRLLQMEDELRLRASRDPEVAAAMGRRAAQHRRWLARGLAAWMAEGLLPSGRDPEALAAVVTGLAQQHRVDPAAVGAEAAVAAVAAVLTAPVPAPVPA